MRKEGTVIKGTVEDEIDAEGFERERKMR